jgi:peptidase A4-like protein
VARKDALGEISGFSPMMRVRAVRNPLTRSPILTSLLAAGTLAFAAVPTDAVAASSTSSNWSGYVARRTGTKFRHVAATWKQPSVACTSSDPTYSAIWVGLGGYSAGSSALEQIGTEVDCNASGRQVSAAWYELVPSPSKGIRMTVKPGDVISASVTVAGHRVALDLADRTRHTSFAKTVTEATVDASSADWIVEAPSICFNDETCRTLSLANFGSVQFTGASAQTASGAKGSISSRLWGTTRITLAPDGRTYIANGIAGKSTPSPLKKGGSAFEVNYGQTTVNPGIPLSKLASVARATSTVQPGGVRR